jgi:hypothetical protein
LVHWRTLCFGCWLLRVFLCALGFQCSFNWWWYVLVMIKNHCFWWASCLVGHYIPICSFWWRLDLLDLWFRRTDAQLSSSSKLGLTNHDIWVHPIVSNLNVLISTNGLHSQWHSWSGLIIYFY